MARRRRAKRSDDTIKYVLIGVAALVVLFLIFNVGPTGKFIDTENTWTPASDAKCVDSIGKDFLIEFKNYPAYDSKTKCVLKWDTTDGGCINFEDNYDTRFANQESCKLKWIPATAASCSDGTSKTINECLGNSEDFLDFINFESTLFDETSDHDYDDITDKDECPNLFSDGQIDLEKVWSWEVENLEKANMVIPTEMPPIEYFPEEVIFNWIHGSDENVINCPEAGHGPNILVPDPNSDYDNDDLVYEEEIKAGTNPINSDTDGDGILDNIDTCPNDAPTIDTDGDGCQDITLIELSEDTIYTLGDLNTVEVPNIFFKADGTLQDDVIIVVGKTAPVRHTSYASDLCPENGLCVIKTDMEFNLADSGAKVISVGGPRHNALSSQLLGVDYMSYLEDSDGDGNGELSQNYFELTDPHEIYAAILHYEDSVEPPPETISEELEQEEETEGSEVEPATSGTGSVTPLSFDTVQYRGGECWTELDSGDETGSAILITEILDGAEVISYQYTQLEDLSKWSSTALAYPESQPGDLGYGELNTERYIVHVDAFGKDNLAGTTCKVMLWRDWSGEPITNALEVIATT